MTKSDLLETFDAVVEARALVAFVTYAWGSPVLAENMDEDARSGMYHALRRAEDLLAGVVEYVRPGRDGWGEHGEARTP